MPVRTLAFILLFPVIVRGGPFDAGGEAERSPATVGAQAAISVDWIRMPKPEAARLLREVLKSATDGPAVHAAVEALISAGRAVRTDFSVLTVTDGGRTKIESIREDPAVPDGSVHIGADGEPEWLPGDVLWTNLGLTMEIEARIAPDLTCVDLAVGTVRQENLAMQQHGSGRCRFGYPERWTDESSFQLILPDGEWRLACCQDVPVPAAKILTDAVDPGYPDVRLTFIRAGIQSWRPAREGGSTPAECLLVSEWIEVGPGRAADLCADAPDALTVRDRLAGDLASGSALLSGISVMPLRTRQRAKSGVIVNPGAPIGTNAQNSVELEILNTGWSMEVEGEYRPSEMRCELSISHERIALEGLDSVTLPGRGFLPAGQIKAVNGRNKSSHLLLPGQTSLAAITGASPLALTGGDTNRRRVRMHFLRIVP